MPGRIIDNLLESEVKLSVVPWNTIESTPDKLGFLINATSNSRLTNKYDLTRPMRMNNSTPSP